MKIFKLFLIILILLTAFIGNPKNAQAAINQCQVAKVVFGGSDHPPTTGVPTNTDFGIKITCLQPLSSTKNISVTFNGVTKTVAGLNGLVFEIQFGNWNFPTATSSDAIIDIPGDTITCSPGCGITMNSGPIPEPLPIPPPPAAGAVGVGSNPCAAGICETALGNIPTSVKGFTAKILTIAIGIAGGIALILMVIGSIRVLASSGDPKAVGAGREMIVAAIAGLLFLIFATLILQFIGISVFNNVTGF